MCRVLDCHTCEFLVEDVDIRKIEMFDVSNCTVIEIKSDPLVENAQIYWMGDCKNNVVQVAELKDARADGRIITTDNISYPVPENTENQILTHFDIESNCYHEVFATGHELGEIGIAHLARLTHFVPAVDTKLRTKSEVQHYIAELESTEFSIPQSVLSAAYDDERKEYNDPEDIFQEKITQLANMIREAKHTVVYTGAGISTSANIPGNSNLL